MTFLLVTRLGAAPRSRRIWCPLGRLLVRTVHENWRGRWGANHGRFVLWQWVNYFTIPTSHNEAAFHSSSFIKLRAFGTMVIGPQSPEAEMLNPGWRNPKRTCWVQQCSGLVIRVEQYCQFMMRYHSSWWLLNVADISCFPPCCCQQNLDALQLYLHNLVPNCPDRSKEFHDARRWELCNRCRGHTNLTQNDHKRVENQSSLEFLAVLQSQTW